LSGGVVGGPGKTGGKVTRIGFFDRGEGMFETDFKGNSTNTKTCTYTNGWKGKDTKTSVAKVTGD